MNPKSEGKSLRFCLNFVTLVALSILGIYIYYRFVDTKFVLDPARLRIYDFETQQTQSVARTEPLGQELLRQAYSAEYMPYILSHDLELSLPFPGGFTLPNVQAGNKIYMLQESPTLRYELWRQAPPHVVLLGSSMMFQNFCRAEFFKMYPNLRLLDFTTSNNTPDTAKYLIDQLEAYGCQIPEGTVFLYGINQLELMDGYAGGVPSYLEEAVGSCSHGYWLPRRWSLFRLGCGDLKQQAWDKTQESLLGLAGLLAPRLQIQSGGRPEPPALLVKVPASETRDPAALTRFFQSQKKLPAPGQPMASQGAASSEQRSSGQPTAGTPPAQVVPPLRPFSPRKVESLRHIVELVQARKGRFLLVKVPTSTVSRNDSAAECRSFEAHIGAVVSRLGISFLDLSDQEALGIDDTYYVYPGNLFNPNHLNYQGSVLFTCHLLRQIPHDWLDPFMGR